MGYPTPEMRDRMKGVKPGTPPAGSAGASSANGDRRRDHEKKEN
jgi:hypothetical protein